MARSSESQFSQWSDRVDLVWVDSHMTTILAATWPLMTLNSYPSPKLQQVPFADLFRTLWHLYLHTPCLTEPSQPLGHEGHVQMTLKAGGGSPELQLRGALRPHWVSRTSSLSGLWVGQCSGQRQALQGSLEPFLVGE